MIQSTRTSVVSNGPMIAWTQPKMDRLQVAYDQAVAAGDDEFKFEGLELVTEYAKYLLQYLKEDFKDA